MESGYLENSPLFNLSLGSKELFHSNFIAWLWKQYPEQLYDIFKDMLPNAAKSKKSISAIFREKQNIDLYVEYDDNYRVVIENKVKSLPNESQLKEYSNKFKDKQKTDFVLLSLTRPSFFTDGKDSHAIDGAIWNFMSYEKLSDGMNRLESLIPKEYHRELWKDYSLFISTLSKLADECRIIWKKDFFSNFSELNKLRIHDLIDKLKYEELAEDVKNEINSLDNLKSNFSIVNLPWVEMPKNAVRIASGMTRSVGLFDLKYAVKGADKKNGSAVIGVQLQGEHLRLFFEIIGKDNHAENIANELYDKGLWFNFKDFPGLDKIDEYPLKNKRFNTFGNSFYYRSKKIGSLNKKELNDISKLIIFFFKEAINNFDTIESVLDKHL